MIKMWFEFDRKTDGEWEDIVYRDASQLKTLIYAQKSRQFQDTNKPRTSAIHNSNVRYVTKSNI